MARNESEEREARKTAADTRGRDARPRVTEPGDAQEAQARAARSGDRTREDGASSNGGLGAPERFSVESEAVLIPTGSFRRLVFADYLERGTQVKLFKGETIATACRQPSDPYLYYVVSGRVEAVFRRDDGTHMRLYERGAGNAFQSEFAGIASQGATRLRFSAMENSVIMSFTYAQVQKLVAEEPRAFEDLVYVTHLTYGQLGHQLDNVNAQSTSRRILVWLKKLVDTSEPDADGRYRIPCELTVQEISELLMIHVTTCSRLLAALKRKGVVDRTRHELVVNDPKQLEQLSLEENPLLY